MKIKLDLYTYLCVYYYSKKRKIIWILEYQE